MNRLYVAEGTPSVTGAMADHKRSSRTSDIAELVDALAGRIGGRLDSARTPAAADPWLDAVAADLLQHRSASIVVAGDRQPPWVHARIHAINEALGNVGKTVELGAPVAFDAGGDLASLHALASAMAAGKVDSLLIVGGNPVYDAPADLAFGDALARVAWKAHLSLYDDETSFRCNWHVPAAHVLETWGDVRAFDGTVTIQQPCIAPLYDGRSAHEVLSAVVDGLARPAHDVVREFWQRALPRADFDAVWHDALRRGVMDAEAPSPRTPTARHGFPVPASPPGTGIELVFAADPTVGDGRHANNAWLQELPKPLTTLTWDNAALLSPALAERLQIANEDVIEIAVGGRSIKLPAWIVPGHADRSLTVYLGHGRSRAGTVGNGVGADAYALRTSTQFWVSDGVSVTKTGTRYALATTQQHNRMEGRDLVRTVTRDQAASCEESACVPAHEGDPRQSLYPAFAYDDYKWGMSIDLSSCIGCAACTIACQAENNIPVVGKKEVRRGRAMHWIRVDRYYAGDRDRPRTVFQPVPCMQCEHAPCEEVCPVEASVHDAEGLNVQVYNRCIGTRFCSNNCPYKVRRFNFFHYARDEPGLAAQRNPEVTVRMRGVMEKCSYCVQRIATARILADRENRRIADSEVVTACQAVCPTRAIVFGDLNDPASEVNKRKASPFDYALLAELNTRPRTTYLPKITNAIPGLEAT
ncbi:MAG: 4Fe-4S dicluster domain-containing protein [Betaproteobacteria bacterium]|nr:MAG: 4Fe-4S dicluster domain-containing protein [Betaproteobacteria bacterium]